MIDCRVKVLEQMAMDVCEQLVVEGELSCAQQLHDARADLVSLLGAAGLLRGYRPTCVIAVEFLRNLGN